MGIMPNHHGKPIVTKVSQDLICVEMLDAVETKPHAGLCSLQLELRREENKRVPQVFILIPNTEQHFYPLCHRRQAKTNWKFLVLGMLKLEDLHKTRNHMSPLLQSNGKQNLKNQEKYFCPQISPVGGKTQMAVHLEMSSLGSEAESKL